ncbi:flagellar basal body rod protein FlgC [Nisaea sp.]|uniref:flagellar basal body rod protein FlgC n=1 Tax=Nisaea sp. TaxID=2024842 RepID=UPI003B5292C5
MDLNSAIKISASGMRAQGTRLRVISENVANADSLGSVKGQDPYRRKTIVFENFVNRDENAEMVRVAKIGRDDSDFELAYEPFHPLADAEGYVRRPNVNSLIEMMDMREAQRTYEANLSSIEMARSMLQRTVDLLRA